MLRRDPTARNGKTQFIILHTIVHSPSGQGLVLQKNCRRQQQSKPAVRNRQSETHANHSKNHPVAEGPDYWEQTAAARDRIRRFILDDEDES